MYWGKIYVQGNIQILSIPFNKFNTCMWRSTIFPSPQKDPSRGLLANPHISPKRQPLTSFVRPQINFVCLEFHRKESYSTSSLLCIHLLTLSLMFLAIIYAVMYTDSCLSQAKKPHRLGGLTNKYLPFIDLEAGKCKIKGPADLLCGESPPPSLQVGWLLAVSSLGRETPSQVSSCKHTNSIYERSPVMTPPHDVNAAQLFSHFAVEKHLACFPTWAAVSKATMHMPGLSVDRWFHFSWVNRKGTMAGPYGRYRFTKEPPNSSPKWLANIWCCQAFFFWSSERVCSGTWLSFKSVIPDDWWHTTLFRVITGHRIFQAVLGERVRPSRATIHQ